MLKASWILLHSMSLNTFYSEFAHITRIKFPLSPRPNLIFTSHTWRHETVHWCITLRRIPSMFKTETLGWLLNIIINHERIPNQITHSFGCRKKCPRTFIQVCAGLPGGHTTSSLRQNDVAMSVDVIMTLLLRRVPLSKPYCKNNVANAVE